MLHFAYLIFVHLVSILSKRVKFSRSSIRDKVLNWLHLLKYYIVENKNISLRFKALAMGRRSWNTLCIYKTISKLPNASFDAYCAVRGCSPSAKKLMNLGYGGSFWFRSNDSFAFGAPTLILKKTSKKKLYLWIRQKMSENPIFIGTSSSLVRPLI